MKYTKEDLKFGNFKSMFDASPFYKRNMAYDSSKRLQYFGIAAPETLNSEAYWIIHRYTYDGATENMLTDRVADHDASFSKEWDDRDLYGYGVADITVAASAVLTLEDTTTSAEEDVDIPAGTYSMSRLATIVATAINANTTVTGWSAATGWTCVYSAATRKFTIATPHISKEFVVKTDTFAAQIGFSVDSTTGLTATSDTAQTEV